MASKGSEQLRFCVIIPMYNEEGGARLCVQAVCAVLDRMPETSNLVVVEDGSKDQTANILQALAIEFERLKVITHLQNRGYGAALNTGINFAVEHGYDYALFMDSDLTNDPADIPRFAREMERGIDVIKASRFTGSGHMHGVPFRRAIVSKTGNLVARILFRVPIRDCTNGFRAVRVPVLAQMKLRERGFPIIVEELYQAKFIASSYAEIPVILTSRSDDQRPSSFAYNYSTLRRYFTYACKAWLKIQPT